MDVFETSLLPPLEFDLLSTQSNSFASSTCTMESGTVIQLSACGPVERPNACMKTTTPLTVTHTNNRLSCTLLAASVADTSFMVRVSSPANPVGTHLDTYIPASEKAVAYIDMFTASLESGVAHLLYKFTHKIETGSVVQGQLKVNVVLGSFHAQHFIHWNPFPGMLAFAAIGGILYFCFILHKLIMYFVSAIFENPWAPALRKETQPQGEYKPLLNSDHRDTLPATADDAASSSQEV